MEQPEIPQEPGTNPPAEDAAPVPGPAPVPPPKIELPDTRNVIPIPEQYRLPFMGKMATPTAVPSAAQRQFNLDRLQKRRRRRGFLTGLLVGQLLIIGLDLGGDLYLKTHPNVTLRVDLPVSSIVFLGMAAGAAVMILAVGLIYGGMGLRGLFGKKPVVATGRGIKRILLTVLTLGVTMGVILGTAWFMIPPPKWTATTEYAKDRGRDALEASKGTVKRWWAPAPKP